MGMQCEVCGKKPVIGNQKTYRGKAKYLGGVGKKITGTSRRTFKPNLQSIRVRQGRQDRPGERVRAVHPLRQGAAAGQAQAVRDAAGLTAASSQPRQPQGSADDR